jgi:hypothetical protein
VGEYLVTLRVTDNGSPSITEESKVNLTVIPNNTVPEISTTPVVKVNENTAYSYDVDAIDPDANEKLTYSLNSAPLGMEIDEVTGVIHWQVLDNYVQSIPVNNEQCYTQLIGSANSADDNNVNKIFYPDLQVGHINYQAINNDRVELSAKIKNLGLADVTEDFKVVFYQGSRLNHKEVGRVNISSLSLGTETLASISLDVESIDRDVFVKLILPINIIECNIKNNYSLAVFVNITVTDNTRLFDQQSYLLNVDDAPEITSDPVLTLQSAQNFNYRVKTQDKDIGDAALFELTAVPEGLSINPRTGQFSSDPEILLVG